MRRRRLPRARARRDRGRGVPCRQHARGSALWIRRRDRRPRRLQSPPAHEERPHLFRIRMPAIRTSSTMPARSIRRSASSACGTGRNSLLGCVVNFACHATTSPGGISANWIYYLEKTIRGAMDYARRRVVFLQGAAGDVTQVDNLSPYARRRRSTGRGSSAGGSAPRR